ncbi:hypothetical protein [Lysinibacillus sp. 38-6]|uniref:hypothetical protein n=1 Tax=Lysinibacillus sp. 38-6 TaxID=3385991 RepID=UPI003908AA17
MSPKINDRKQQQKKIQVLYRKMKQQQQEDEAVSKITKIMINICVVLAILFLVLHAIIGDL